MKMYAEKKYAPHMYSKLSMCETGVMRWLAPFAKNMQRTIISTFF